MVGFVPARVAVKLFAVLAKSKPVSKNSGVPLLPWMTKPPWVVTLLMRTSPLPLRMAFCEPLGRMAFSSVTLPFEVVNVTLPFKLAA